MIKKIALFSLVYLGISSAMDKAPKAPILKAQDDPNNNAPTLNISESFKLSDDEEKETPGKEENHFSNKQGKQSKKKTTFSIAKHLKAKNQQKEFGF